MSYSRNFQTKKPVIYLKISIFIVYQFTKLVFVQQKVPDPLSTDNDGKICLRLSRVFRMALLEPGDLYRINITVTSQSRRAVQRKYQRVESTIPVEPVLKLPVSVTEHTMALQWTSSGFYEVRKIINASR